MSVLSVEGELNGRRVVVQRSGWIASLSELINSTGALLSSGYNLRFFQRRQLSLVASALRLRRVLYIGHPHRLAGFPPEIFPVKIVTNREKACPPERGDRDNYVVVLDDTRENSCKR